MRIQLLFPLLITSLLLSACDGNPSTWVNQYWPRVNPDQKYTMTIDGYLDPSLADLIDLQFNVKYRTTNPSCQKYASLLEGAAFDREKTIHYPVKKAGEFQLKLSLDYYLPGACQWILSSINYDALYTSSEESFAYMPIAFYEKNARVTRQGYSTFICNEKYNLHSCNGGSYSFFNEDMTIGMGNYTFQLIIKVEEHANHS